MILFGFIASVLPAHLSFRMFARMNKQEPTKESVKKLLDYLSKRLFHVQNYYFIYSELGLHYNKAVNEEAAKAYLSVINKHKGFFMPVQECLRATLTVELCSFVVKQERKYKSLGRAIDELKQLPGGPDLNKKYDRLLSNNANIIGHIKQFRNQYYAHKSFADLPTLQASSDKEYRNLLSDMYQLLNEANSYLGTGVLFTEDAIDDTHSMMNNLLHDELGRNNDTQVVRISDLYHEGWSNWHKSGH